MNLGDIKIIKFPSFVDSRGSLCFGEFPKHLPFVVERFFLIYDTPEGAVRGEHAHKKCIQVHVCVHGEVEMTVDSGVEKKVFVMNSSDTGIMLPPYAWHHIKMGKDSVLLVLTSEAYSEEDYIRNYDEFLQLCNL